MKNEQPAGSQTRPAKVAIIEDNADTRDLLSVVLTDIYEVVTFPTVAEALEQIPAQNPGVILCDLLLPDMSGWEFISRFRSDGIQVPVIAVTAHVVQGVRDQALAAGFDEFVSKPILDLNHLIDLINRFHSRSTA